MNKDSLSRNYPECQQTGGSELTSKRVYSSPTVAAVDIRTDCSFLAASVPSTIQSVGQKTETVNLSSSDFNIDGFDTEWGIE